MERHIGLTACSVVHKTTYTILKSVTTGWYLRQDLGSLGIIGFNHPDKAQAQKDVGLNEGLDGLPIPQHATRLKEQGTVSPQAVTY